MSANSNPLIVRPTTNIQKFIDLTPQREALDKAFALPAHINLGDGEIVDNNLFGLLRVHAGGHAILDAAEAGRVTLPDELTDPNTAYKFAIKMSISVAGEVLKQSGSEPDRKK